MSDHNANEFLNFCRKFDQAKLVTHSLQGLIAIPLLIAGERPKVDTNVLRTVTL